LAPTRTATVGTPPLELELWAEATAVMAARARTENCMLAELIEVGTKKRSLLAEG